MRKTLINFDANATWGMDEDIVTECLGKIKSFGTVLNPSSIHTGGQRARGLLDEARDEVRRLVSAPSSVDVLFTSGATESNNLAVHSVLQFDPAKISVVTSSVEHHSILQPMNELSSKGYGIVFLGPRDLVSPVLTPPSSATKVFVSLQHANNETGGVYSPKTTVRSLKSGNSVISHSDVVQSVGKIPVAWDELEVDSMSISGHKLGAPAGIGALLVRKNHYVQPMLLGGTQENRLRAGTENLLGAVCLGVAARRAREQFDTRTRLMAMNKKLVKERLALLSEIEFPFESERTLPNTLSVRIGGVRADDLVVAADLAGVAVSSGAACASGKPDPSHVLLAYGMSRSQAMQTIRISVLPSYAEGEVERGVDLLVGAIKKMRGGT